MLSFEGEGRSPRNWRNGLIKYHTNVEAIVIKTVINIIVLPVGGRLNIYSTRHTAVITSMDIPRKTRVPRRR
jgi:hypothetical protein